MKLEVGCPHCGKAYLVEEESIGGQFICPSCAAHFVVEVPVGAGTIANAQPSPTASDRPTLPVSTSDAPTVLTSAAEAAAMSAPDAVSPPVSTTAAAPEPAPPQAPVKTAEPVTASEVVCPRCQLHFTPRRRASDEPLTDRPTVLIVGEAGYFRETAEQVLSDSCVVKTADGALAARNLLEAGGIDLALLDIDDEAQGIALLGQLSAKPCPILLYTAQDEAEMYDGRWEQLQAQGADDIVIKGMNVAESLVRKAGTLLGRQWDDEEEIE